MVLIEGQLKSSIGEFITMYSKTVKSICLVLLLAVVFCFSSCSDNSTNDAVVEEAIDEIKSFWSEQYADQQVQDGEVEIIYTRFIKISDDSDDIFEDMDYIVEFVLLYNFSESDYDSVAQHGNCVCVYKDGTKKVMGNPFQIYRSKKFTNDFSHLIESVEDMKDKYNRVLNIE